MTQKRGSVRVHIDRGITIPPGGIAIVSPFDGSETIVRSVPANVAIRRADPKERP
jgi:hypothetical protein